MKRNITGHPYYPIEFFTTLADLIGNASANDEPDSEWLFDTITHLIRVSEKIDTPNAHMEFENDTQKVTIQFQIEIEDTTS